QVDFILHVHSLESVGGFQPKHTLPPTDFLAEHQKEHMLKAFETAGSQSVEGFWKVLSALLADENRIELLSHINKDMGE
ncbi:MAG: hypothetical protein JKY59_01665, partial [Emcibacter sp.]|nr:hypothetical protein [Emcibacter sp.]